VVSGQYNDTGLFITHHSPLTTMQTYEIGAMANNLERDRLRAFAAAAAHGFRVVHTSALREAWLTGPERAAYVTAARSGGIRVATMFVGFDGQSYADRDSIARTVGLVVPELRDRRCRLALLYSDLARELEVDSLGMHIGFIPETTDRPDYQGLVAAVRTIVDHCAHNGQTFHIETGQESADLLAQFINDVDRANLGVNFDPANFVLYGTDEPLAALERLGPWVGGVHCKDGLQPRRPGQLGTEVPIGQGEVPFPALIRKLCELGYRGPLIIEREQGPSVVEDILAARKYLEGCLAVGHDADRDKPVSRSAS
jgi:sugar phosphate isomerase/epimerase